MPSCVFRKCYNYTGTVKEKKDISFHLIPRDERLQIKWVEVIRKQRSEHDWMPSPHTAVCSDHFSPSDICVTKKKNIRRLKKTAVPVIIKHEEERSVTSNSLEQENMSDDSIFDSPEKAYLKMEVRKLSDIKRKLQIRNNNLLRQNKRLKAKCVTLKKIVLRLRRENKKLEC